MVSRSRGRSVTRKIPSKKNKRKVKSNSPLSNKVPPKSKRCTVVKDNHHVMYYTISKGWISIPLSLENKVKVLGD
jgi:hypothetical protein